MSRQRKKLYLDELERKVNILTAETEKLNNKNASLTKENQKLKDEIIKLHVTIKQLQENKPLAASKTAKAAGICLLVVLFSFGLLYNATSRQPFEDSINGRARMIGNRILLPFIFEN